MSCSSDEFEASSPLPPVDAASFGTQPTTRQDAPSVATPLRMLYVEDNRINALLFENAMQLRTDVDLRIAEDGQDALAQIQPDWQPEVLVIDSHLPDTDGFMLLAALRTHHGLTDVPAYMCSADAADEDKMRARAAGFAGYWTKPVDFHEVMAEIDAMLLKPRHS